MDVADDFKNVVAPLPALRAVELVSPAFNLLGRGIAAVRAPSMANKEHLPRVIH